ncbi:MAG: kumamolisin [Frankiales bacterium]|nr:kumamolisin [Frankiales bacterium]
MTRPRGLRSAPQRLPARATWERPLGVTRLPRVERPTQDLRVRRVLVLPLTAAIGVAVALPTLLPAAAQAEGSGIGSATVLLRTAGSAEALAQAGNLPRSARLARLRGTMPSAATQADVLATVRDLGLTVDDATPWSLVVHGSASSLHRLARLSGVSSVLLAGGPEPSAAAAPVQLRGSQLRTAYQASSAQPPTSAVTPIIATIQFSGWDSAELAGYVSSANALRNAPALPAPTASTYTAIRVGTASSTALAEPGSSEVALDQESIYDTAPYALQRAYFADGSTAGFVAALNRVAADAQNLPGLVALSISWTWCTSLLGGPELQAMHDALANVVAAGVSVFTASGDDGAYCQAGGRHDVSYPAADPLAIAVGGTSLTLSPTSETGWGAPDPSRASGFYGSGGGASPIQAASWQTAVTGAGNREVPDISSDADMDTGFLSWHQRDASGVGWQLSGGTSLASPVSAALYVAELGARGATNGGLGDLHSVLYSAPAADFRDIVSGSNGFYTAKAGYDMVTGLGAPLWSKVVDRLLTQPVISVPPTLDTRVVPVTVSAPAGQTFVAWTTGYGNPPSACGSSAGQPLAPASVTVPADGSYRIWAEGYVGDRHCFIVSTTTVVTTVTPTPPTTPPASTPPATTPPVVVGQPVITPTTPAAPDPDVTPPTVVLSARQTSLGTAAVSYSWRVSDGSGSGVDTVAATVFRDNKPVWTGQVKPSASLTLSGRAGHSYRLAILAVDVAGNTAGFASNTVRLPYDDRSFTVSKGWSRASSRAAFDGSYVTSARSGASASITAAGKTYSLLTRTGPGEGIVGVYVDGRHVRDLTLYSKTSRSHVVVVLARFGTVKSHRITLLVKGKRPAHGKGVTVAVDGLLAL